VGTTRSRVVGLAAAGLSNEAGFFFGLTVAGLVATVDFSMGFLGPAVFLVVVTIGCEGASVTRIRWWGCGGLDNTHPRTT
jgi:hypothetical protein